MKNEFFDSSQKRGVSVGTVVLIVLAAVLITALVLMAMLREFPASIGIDPPPSPRASAPLPATTPLPSSVDPERETAFSRVFRENCESVVVITTYVTYEGKLTKYGSGSGFFIREDGVIVTNNHMITEIEAVKVRTYEGDEYDADILGGDERSEIAVLKIKDDQRKDREFSAVTCGDSDQVTVGEYALAIGSPMGFEFSLSVGIVSGLQRAVDSNVYRFKMIQTDTALNSGSSGGPLLNIRGEVIGVNTMKSRQSITGASVEGMGFAVPINKAMKVANQLLETGKVTHAAIQASVGTLVDQDNQPLGVRVAEVVEDGAAAKAGVQADDVIVAFNGRAVMMVNDLMEQLDDCEPGQTVVLTVLRGEVTLEISVVLGSM
ncbi:MAG: trypsin-like peptidase domain-containing protein [Clostridia bacterium]|nr:trypsin-like peptidase domain-containing protein [Clostridia bacterium]